MDTPPSGHPNPLSLTQNSAKPRKISYQAMQIPHQPWGWHTLGRRKKKLDKQKYSLQAQVVIMALRLAFFYTLGILLYTWPNIGLRHPCIKKKKSSSKGFLEGIGSTWSKAFNLSESSIRSVWELMLIPGLVVLENVPRSICLSGKSLRIWIHMHVAL